ncbi:MAG: Cation/multidrug efflux pump [Phormidesmis priestleyi Ana]|uniref:Cation/multidrug efflux pump n=1 Tax=Phormidesmis priestleyi Ana TaxID=1666911 RepID=A0A0P7ZS01_9CYAN|nr:MAG: Cation/multidrug efflux pump [Phormidesmis priestleyi Ana]
MSSASGPVVPSHPGVEKASRFARFFFLKPIFGILLALLLTVGGLLAYFSLVKESNPDINIATAIVTTTWGGADPTTIEQQVTNELESEIQSVEGLKSIQSASYDGFSLINVEFNSNADVDQSIQRLRDAVALAEPDLPSEADQPVVEQVSVNDAPIITLALFGDLDPTVLSQAAEDLQDRLEDVPGVTEVNLGGAREEVVQIQLNPSRLAALELSPEAIANSIRSANVDAPLNQIESDAIGTQVRLYGKFRRLEDLRQLPVARIDNRVVRLEEVASVRRELAQEETRAAISWEGTPYEPVVSVGVTKVPGQDSIAVINSVLAEVEAAQSSSEWPFGLDYRVTANDADIIWEQLGSLFVNALQAMAAVFVILFIALSWREALIAGLSIPLTFLGTLAVLWLLGQTLNNMVLIGMVLALGILVDVFILMMEGMHEGIFVSGLSFNQAALRTVRTYSGPAFAGQLTTILAMTPLMSISGTLGKFIRVLPITAVTCLILSFVIALFVDIPLSRYLLAGIKKNHQKSRIDRLSERASERFSRWSLRYTVRNKAIARAWSLGALALFICSIFAFTQLPVTFFPEQDSRKLSINVELAPTTTLNTSQAVADDIGRLLSEKDYFESVIKYTGQRSNLVSSGELQPTEGSYLVGFSAVFEPEDERELISYEYLDDLRDELEAALQQYPGASLVVNAQSATGAGDPIQIELSGDDITQLRQISAEVQQALRQIPGSSDVRDNLGDLQPDLQLVPRREALDFYGLTAQAVTTQARYYTTAVDVGDFDLGGNEEDLEIRLSTAWPSRNGEVGGPTRRDELNLIRFFGSNADNEVIPVGAVVDPVQSESALSITHRGGERTVTVLSKTSDRTVGEILGDLEPKLTELQESWPAGYQYSLGGETEDQAETFGSAGQALAIAILLVFSVLVIQLSSFRQPFIILFTIPLALIGTFVGYFIFLIPFSFSTFIGVIALVGVVVNDAIVMVDTMNGYQAEGMTVQKAAANGVADRLRPILTTSVTTIIGLIPLALSDPTWMPLCAAIIFGLIAATGTALIIVPCLYLQFTPKTEHRNSELLTHSPST